eukprot:TRINITY_DN1195_c0_g3_i1.p2 TRINITY_DN1195_c0_g3~~TRINITY_DN1195_c0_g3_i1.p2  ORF type:complete len:106 (-),score=6.98 TRINITY_DN1195_c0_g3_i1:310-627(-)
MTAFFHEQYKNQFRKKILNFNTIFSASTTYFIVGDANNIREADAFVQNQISQKPVQSKPTFNEFKEQNQSIQLRQQMSPSKMSSAASPQSLPSLPCCSRVDPAYI